MIIVKKELMNIIESNAINVPKACTEALEKSFSRAINIDWQQVQANFEAIFYQDDLEYIALFQADGMLIEYRKIVPAGYLPFAIRQLVLEKGEVMNRLMVNRGNELFYEVIYRDEALNRFMLLINDQGNIIKHQKL